MIQSTSLQQHFYVQGWRQIESNINLHDVRKNMTQITSVTTAEGFEMWVDPADKLISAAIIPTKTWEPHVTAVFKRELASRRGAVFVDVGANMGWFALVAAMLPQCGKVIALEPNHGNLQLLSRSILANKLNKITVYPYAAGDKPQQMRLFSSSGPTGTGFVVPADENRDVNGTFVQCVRLDDLLKDEPKIDIVKMDIDGHEPTVLKGMLQLVARHQPVIFSEFFPKGIRQLAGMEPEDYLEMLAGLGYQFAAIQTDGTELACDGVKNVMDFWRRHGEVLGIGEDVHVDLVARPVGVKKPQKSMLRAAMSFFRPESLNTSCM